MVSGFWWTDRVGGSELQRSSARNERWPQDPPIPEYFDINLGGQAEPTEAYCCTPEGGESAVPTTSEVKRRRGIVGQAKKCTWWMPRHEPAKKDVASCEKPRGAASEHRSGDVRMGKPFRVLSPETPTGEPTQGTETSQYLEEEKSTEIP
jgi:hypothetical protein